MGQVTIGELTEDLLPFTEKGNKVITIPIVPRAIPEKIIERCNKLITPNPYNKQEIAVNIALCDIKQLVIELLTEFEEGGVRR